jgi:hypothetical protein
VFSLFVRLAEEEQCCALAQQCPNLPPHKRPAQAAPPAQRLDVDVALREQLVQARYYGFGSSITGGSVGDSPWLRCWRISSSSSLSKGTTSATPRAATGAAAASFTMVRERV